QLILQILAAAGVKVELVLGDSRVVERAEGGADLLPTDDDAGAGLPRVRLPALAACSRRRRGGGSGCWQVRQSYEGFVFRRLPEFVTNGLDGDLRTVNSLPLEGGANRIGVRLLLELRVHDCSAREINAHVERMGVGIAVKPAPHD